VDILCTFLYQEKRKYTNDLTMRLVLIFGMLDTSRMVTPFNVLWSHNVAHSCNHATFNVVCCYDILQHLLRICMSTKASEKSRAIQHPTLSTCRNILRFLTFKQYISCL
jgi:hypothetical protein